ncbi:hypothetical protein A3860_35550 [Niastella vici]|uniref:Methyltransferase n=1 Tax=Niastella vici TaxID=1703345 RepID=A0A1V9FNP6_9BACT|nr:class I SAM-dependent methyltransferase [Niastella vici]OQP59960.1 hypothetical protein A3860_35550 [Niastella vici]
MNLWVKKKIKKYLRKLNVETDTFKTISPEVANILARNTDPSQVESFVAGLKKQGAPAWFENTTTITSKEIFQHNNKPLPCWLERDYNPQDDWLNHPSYYPLYFNLFKSFSKNSQQVNLLEIGVRSGYMSAVFAKAVKCPSNYVGIDPNLYLPNGLDYAAATCKIMNTANPQFHYMLINGYSWDSKIMKSLELSPKYDIIHIDGDHTKTGKLIDLHLCSHLTNENGIVLVDDFLHHQFIQESVYLAIQAGWYKKVFYVDSFRGMAILQ